MIKRAVLILAFKNKVQVTIDGRTFSIMGTESEEYLQKVAAYIDEKMKELKRSGAQGSLSPVTLYFLTSLNIADELFKANDELDMVKKEFSDFRNGVLSDEEIKSIQNETLSLKEDINKLVSEIEELKRKLSIIEDEKASLEHELDKYVYALDSTGNVHKANYGFKNSNGYK